MDLTRTVSTNSVVKSPIARRSGHHLSNSNSDTLCCSHIPPFPHLYLAVPCLQIMSFKSTNNIVNVGMAVQADWNNRQPSSSLGLNARKMFEFVSQYDAAARTKLVTLNEKLSNLERQMEVLEAHMSTAMNSSDQF